MDVRKLANLTHVGGSCSIWERTYITLN